MKYGVHHQRAAFSGQVVSVVVLSAIVWLSVSFVMQFLEALDRPEVHVSYETRECVEVVDRKALHEGRASEWSCSNLPPKYERVWVY
jgi:hypothetical protein